MRPNAHSLPLLTIVSALPNEATERPIWPNDEPETAVIPLKAQVSTPTKPSQPQTTGFMVASSAEPAPPPEAANPKLHKYDEFVKFYLEYMNRA